jgi:hypothetical protein
MYNTPLRLTILHFEQRFLIDAVTFIIISPYLHGGNTPGGVAQPKLQLYLFLHHPSSILCCGQYQRTVLCDGNAVLEMRSQRAIG